MNERVLHVKAFIQVWGFISALDLHEGIPPDVISLLQENKHISSTPEGYTRSSFGIIRKAGSKEAGRCKYNMHLVYKVRDILYRSAT